jgi:hypothetical protein
MAWACRLQNPSSPFKRYKLKKFAKDISLKGAQWKREHAANANHTLMLM